MDLRLKAGKDRPVRFGHPWIYSGAIHDLPSDAEPGAVVRVLDSYGQFLGRGYVNPHCTIAVRMLTRLDEPIDSGFISRRIAAAAALRSTLVSADTTAYRLIHGEGDSLPGVIVDRYADVLVVQILTAGAERLREAIAGALRDILRPAAIYERSEGAVRRAEGLAGSVGWIYGDPVERVTIFENGLGFEVDLVGGQKTGFFLDQRENRRLLRGIAAGKRVLDAFSHTGGFAVHAAAGGAVKVTLVDSSARALQTARRNWQLNGLPENAAAFVDSNVARFLNETTETFDLIVLDPPALVKRRQDVQRGARMYKDLQLRAFRRLASGGFLVTFTCSPHVDAELFRKIVSAAAADAQRPVQLLQHLGAGPDHPIALGHREGEYLHGLLLRA